MNDYAALVDLIRDKDAVIRELQEVLEGYQESVVDRDKAMRTLNKEVKALLVDAPDKLGDDDTAEITFTVLVRDLRPFY